MVSVLAGACGDDAAVDGSAGSGGATGGGGGVSQAATSTSAEMATSTSTGGAGGGEALRERLAPSLAALTEPPFGTAAAIAASDGAISVTVGDGVLFDGGPPADADTLFNVASVSKVLTAARVVSLAHEDRLGLDEALADHLPGVALIDEGGVDRAGDVTLRDLLQHRGGLPHQPPDLEEQVDDRWSDPDLLQLIFASWSVDLVAAPGEFSYSNLGYAMLAAIVEQEGDCSFADCMAPYLDELGMASATFWPAGLGEGAAHGRVEIDGAVTFHPPGWYASRYAIPFTGLWTTMPDLARFGATLAEATRDPGAPLAAMTEGDGYGLGIIHGQRLGAPSLEHDGSGPGFYGALVVVPAENVVVALATSGGNESQDEVAVFSGIVEAAVSAVP